MGFPTATLLSYIGPETVLPLASILGAIGGALMMFWTTIRRGLTWCTQKVMSSASRGESCEQQN